MTTKTDIEVPRSAKDLEQALFSENRLQAKNREFRAENAGAAALAPGWVIMTEFRTEGGVKYSRQDAGSIAKGLEGMILSGQKPDDARLAAFATSTINRASYLMETMTAPLFAGLYYCAPDVLPKLRKEMIECQIAAEDCNKASAEMGSKRETRIRIYSNFLNVSDVDTSFRFAEITRKRLMILRDNYKDTPSNYRNALAPVKNAWQAVVGKQREVLQIAINSGEEQRANGIMIYHAGGRRNTEELIRTTGGKVPPIDYKPIDAAIEMFGKAKGWSMKLHKS